MYSLGIIITFAVLRIISIWDEKTRLFVNGRKGLIKKIRSAVGDAKNIIWFHASSMGEFEEARPVIEATRKRFPEKKILLTFFSPSGYEARKNWPGADWVFYLPVDTASNARKFVKTVHPEKAIFTIGEIWFNILRQLRKHGIDTYIMSVRAVPESPYTKWYGGIFRRVMRKSYKSIMVKDDSTLKILQGFGCRNAVKTGDARFDRVLAVESEQWNDRITDIWSGGSKVFVSGSSHREENEMTAVLANTFPEKKILVIPHQLDREPIMELVKAINGKTAVYSEVEKETNPDDILKEAQVLIIDKIGMLSKLYRYGYAALIGGGFTTLPHSVMEAAVYGMPVAMGPLYNKNLQFVELKELGAATPVSVPQDLVRWLRELDENPSLLEKESKTAYEYCHANGGATEAIMDIIYQTTTSTTSSL